jgi:hypothetical protein
VLSAVPMGACRPCPSRRKERHGKHASTRPHRSPSGSTPTWTCMWPRSWTRPAGCLAPRVRGLDPRLCRPGDLGRTLWAGGTHRGGRHRHLPGRPGPLCARLRAGGGRGEPARPQPAAAPWQVGPDRRPGRRPVDPGRGGCHHAQDPRGPGRDDPDPAGRPPRRPQGPGSLRSPAVRGALQRP